MYCKEVLGKPSQESVMDYSGAVRGKYEFVCTSIAGSGLSRQVCWVMFAGSCLLGYVC